MSELKTIPDVVSHAAREFGSSVAIKDGELTYTFAELEEARLQAARAFLALGVERGDRVAIWGPNIHEWIIAAIGLQSLGAALVTVNTRWKGSEAAYALQKSGAKVLLTVGDFLGLNFAEVIAKEDTPALEHIVLLRGEASNATNWSNFLAKGNDVDLQRAHEASAAVSGDDPLDILFTSGTTGKPKGVVTSHAQSIRVFETWSNAVGLRKGDNYMIIAPFFHSFGYKAGWLAALIKGATILPVLTFDIDAVLEQIEKDAVTVLPGPPTIYQTLLAHPKRKDSDTSSLRLAVTGAAPVPVELQSRMANELGFDTVLTAYGLTESCGVVTIADPSDDPQLIADTEGRAIPGSEVKCVNSDGETVAAGESGEILVRGYNVMQGYFDAPEETAKAIDKDGWLHTGDIGVLDENGYLMITDRIKDMFIVGGFNCYPAEIEASLSSLHSIAQAAVIGVPDERMGEVAKAFIVRTEGSDLSAEDIVAWCKENMANYKVPRYVEFLSEMPLNASGKVLKNDLRAR